MRNKFPTSLWISALSLACAVTAAQAAPKVKPKAKSTAPKRTVIKPKPQGPRGMVPMAGIDGKLGQTYTIGKDNPINFTLNSAEYTLERVNIGKSVTVPEKGEKLLVLRYTVHNPQKKEFGYYWSTVGFTAVDAMNQNREWIQEVGARETGDKLDIRLKPAQKVDGYTVIKVPAKGMVPKLIATPSWGGGVIRYDLRNVVKPLPKPFSEDGTTALEEIPAQAGTYYPFNEMDIKLLETSYVDALGDILPEANQRFFVATVSIRNATKSEHAYYWATIKPDLVDADGEKISWPQVLLKGSRNEKAEGRLGPGEEYKARFYFPLPKDVAAKTLKIAQGESHVYSFDVSNTK